ncbi:MAG: TM2 domain-containing protein [Bacteroidales bacterium]|nr:TM2 domain-containing protein [Bacteroidales bacterium]MBR5093276.1 TM2 domain-containing protein [Bacteroidales bacterium]
MKKIVLALVAVFAMSTMTMAQTELNFDKLQNQQEATIGNYFADLQEVENFDFDQLKDLSFSTENGMVKLDNNFQAGNDNVVGAILAIFLGDFGIHHFYTGDTKHGILHLVFFWTGIPGIIGFIEGIMWLIDPATFPNDLFHMF